MSAIAAGLSGERAARFYDTTIGQKVVMAVSGIALFLFVIAHLLGNLQFFEGPEKMNAYGRFLRIEPALLWAARLGLLVMVLAHIWSAVRLALRKMEARPVRYVKKKAIASGYASRTMYWSGPIIAVFVIYHLLDFTFGTLNPGYQEGAVYENIVRSFSNPVVAIFYIVAMAMLCTHLSHGLWSMFQTLGVASPTQKPTIKRLAAVIAIAIFLGFSSIPLAVLTGLKR
jgi:succinate dehydrogenase / fumarate reductase cytochrome b subunit